MITVQDLVAWEATNGKITPHSVVLMYAGWGKFYRDQRKYFGLKEGSALNDTQDFHFPGFSGEAAQWLLDNRDIAGVATECASFDHGQSKVFNAHKIILGGGKWGL